MRAVLRGTVAGGFVAFMLAYGLRCLTRFLSPDMAAFVGAAFILLAVSSWVGQHVVLQAEDPSPLVFDTQVQAHAGWSRPLSMVAAGLWIDWIAASPYAVLGLYVAVVHFFLMPITRWLWRRWRRTPVRLNPLRLLYSITALACGVVLGTLLKQVVT